MHAPLSGLRVLSFESVGAAPYGTMLMAMMGAEVIRIEGPQGDPARRTGPPTLGPNDSLYFQSLNLGKKSVALDIQSSDGRAAFQKLVRTADAVVNNLRGNQPAKLGLDYAALKPINPRIVCGHISAYGRDNERADWPGFDFLMQAEAGLMDMTGEPGSPPTRAGVSIIDYMTGAILAFGVVSALRKAAETGEGGDVDACLFDTAVHQLCYQGMWYLNAGLTTTKTPRSAHPNLTPVQLFRTQDGWIYVAAMSDKFWEELCAAIGRRELLVDARFATNELRARSRDELTVLLDAVFELAPSAAWVQRLKGRVPAAPVLSLAQALDNPFVRAIGMTAATPHPAMPDMKALGAPLRIDGQRPRVGHAPLLDQDGEALRGPRLLTGPG